MKSDLLEYTPDDFVQMYKELKIPATTGTMHRNGACCALGCLYMSEHREDIGKDFGYENQEIWNWVNQTFDRSKVDDFVSGFDTYDYEGDDKYGIHGNVVRLKLIKEGLLC